jgi:hypothetical protein
MLIKKNKKIIDESWFVVDDYEKNIKIDEIDEQYSLKLLVFC